MPWNSTWPIISSSVKQNGPTGVDNTNYIKDTMGGVPLSTNIAGTTDHFWDVAAGLNGHHRFVKLPNYAADPIIDDASIRGVAFAKAPSASATRIELFYKNGQATYQVSPTYVTGTFAVTNSFTMITTLPANVYGHIFFTKDSNPDLCCEAIVSSGAATARGFTLRVRSSGSGFGSFDYAIDLRNTGGDGLNLFGTRGDGSSSLDGNWSWKLTYRAI